MKKSKLPLIALTWICGAVPLFAKSELETLRSLCAEQERQIRQLEDDNAKLRSLNNLSATRNSDKTDPAAVPASTAAPAVNAKGDKTSTGKADKTSTGKADKTSPVKGDRIYPVKDGETFTSIGKKFGIPTATLIAANPNVKPSAMRPGQVIHLTMQAQTPGTSAKPPAAADEPSAKTAAAIKAATAINATPVSEKTPSPLPPQTAPKAPPVPVLAAKQPVKPLPATTAPTPPSTTTLPPVPVLAAKQPVKPLAATTTTPTPPSSAKPLAESPSAKANIRSVPINGNTTYGEFAAKHGTTVSRLNELNALDLVATAPLAKGSELNVPIQP